MVQLVDPGIGAQLTYQLTPELSLGDGLHVPEPSVPAERPAPAPRRRIPGRNRTDDGGVGQETEIPIFATLRWKPDADGRARPERRRGRGRGNLRVEDEDGGRLADDDYDPAGILAFKGRILF
jgi:hypothetical protein